MNAKCAKCQAEYEKKSELDSIFCPHCQIKSEVKVNEVLWAMFLVFGFIGVGMFLPLLIIPLASGTENGYFIMENRKGPPLKITPFALLIVNLINTGLIITFFILSKRFKEKLEKTKLRLSEIENNDVHQKSGEGKEINMRNLTKILLITATFIPAISAQNSVVPIVHGETLLGGAQNGKWINAEQTDKQMKDKTEYKAINFNEFSLGVFVGTKDDRGVCENPRITFAKLYPDVEDNVNSPLMLGTFADWDPLPRLSKKLLSSNKTNQKIVAEFLKTKGIGKTKIKIIQAFRIDLEGDGKDEIIITGNYFKNAKEGEEIAADGKQNSGDYSFVLLRKIIKGKPQNIFIEGDFYTSKLLRSGEYPMPGVREITAIADLNGDGKMEFVLWEIYYEGNRTAVLEMKNGKAVKVLEAECSV